MGLITIEGYDKKVDLKEVEKSVIQLSGKYFWRDDKERIVKIDKRFYRKESPLVCYCETIADYTLKKDCVFTNDNQWLLLEHEDTINIDGYYHQRKYCLQVNSKWYLKSDKSLVKCYLANKHILRSSAIKLSPKYYGDNAYVTNTSTYNSKLITDVNSHKILKSDSAPFVTANGDIVQVHVQYIDRGFLRVFVGFKSSSEPNFKSINIGFANNADIENFESFDGLDVLVHKKHSSKITTALEHYTKTVLIPKTLEIKKTLKYSEDGPDENQAVVISQAFRRFRGNEILFQPNSSSIEFSKNKDKTGGIGYTFGVEIETSAGLLSDSVCNSLELTKVGDGSIGSAEYVTVPLHGTIGINKLQKIMETLASSTFVDDRCAIHIHVGGAKNEYVETPNFSDHQFIKQAILLGCALEKDLYRICPPTRHPEYKHCHSIRRYSPINDDNLLYYMGMFVFGPQEHWDESYSVNSYKYGQDNISKQTTLGNYCGGRYKWLNLVNCLSKSRHETLEIRLFAGSTSFAKVYNYVLLSLGYVKTIEARVKNPKLKIESLSDMISFAYSGDLEKMLLSFVSERKKRFKRVKIYNRLPSPFIFNSKKSESPTPSIPSTTDTLQTLEGLSHEIRRRVREDSPERIRRSTTSIPPHNIIWNAPVVGGTGRNEEQINDNEF